MKTMIQEAYQRTKLYMFTLALILMKIPEYFMQRGLALMNNKRGEPGHNMAAKVVGVVIGLVFVIVGIFFYTVLAPITATQIIGSNTTSIAKLPGGAGLVTLYQFVGTLFIIFGVIVFLGVLSALALGVL